MIGFFDALIISIGRYLSNQCNGSAVREGATYSLRKAKTSSGWSSAFLTVGQCLMTSPLGPMTTVERMVPSTVLPYMTFFPKAPYFFMTSSWGSDKSVNGSLYLAANLLCESTLSLLTPNTTAPDFFNEDPRSRNPHASFVQPGVSSLG